MPELQLQMGGPPGKVRMGPGKGMPPSTVLAPPESVQPEQGQGDVQGRLTILSKLWNG